eukprot:TRINITY_DN1017_c0_g1_i1.p1 TRINITY_DN1017_c0_g1~~TRINITY_DN1017_c0_g1_i1.p1  ORF type:complete len:226 (+),score=49.03 TRINITY_DN1017_c0_g1_i1:690-1367(+)
MNAVFPGLNVLIALILSFISIHPSIQAHHPSGSGLLQSAVVTLYSSYLIFSAATSEPNSDGFHCNPIDNTSGTFSTLLLGASFTIIAVCFSTVRTATKGDDLFGNDESKMDLLADAGSSDDEEDDLEEDGLKKKNKKIEVADLDDEEEKVSYNYTFFHITFMLAAMFVMMLITNWQKISVEDDNSLKVNHGFAAVYVKLVSSWMVGLLYLWTLVAPCLFPDRVFN